MENKVILEEFVGRNQRGRCAELGQAFEQPLVVGSLDMDKKVQIFCVARNGMVTDRHAAYNQVPNPGGVESRQ